jgi:hypothetical protein
MGLGLLLFILVSAPTFHVTREHHSDPGADRADNSEYADL